MHISYIPLPPFQSCPSLPSPFPPLVVNVVLWCRSFDFVKKQYFCHTSSTQTLSTLYIVLLKWLHSRSFVLFSSSPFFFKSACNMNCMNTLFRDVLPPCQCSDVVHVRHTVYPSVKMSWCYMIRPQWILAVNTVNVEPSQLVTKATVWIQIHSM